MLATLTLVAGLAFAHPGHDVLVDHLTRQITFHPGDARLYLRRARTYCDGEHYDEALADCDRAATLDPDSLDVQLIRARIRLDQHQPDQAIRHVDLVIARTPTFASAHAMRGDALLALGRPLDAADAYGEAIRCTPDARPEQFLRRAAAIAAAGPEHLDDAIACLDGGIAVLGPLVSLTSAIHTLDARRIVEPPPTRTDDATSSPIPTPDVATSIAPGRATIVRGPYLQRATPTAMTIRWRTAAPAESIVAFRRAGDEAALTRIMTPARTEHELTLDHLDPATPYEYAVLPSRDAAPASWTTFRTPPTRGTRTPVRAWIIGDSGTADANASRVRDAYRAFSGARRTDLWLMLGDNAYESGTQDEYQRAVFEMYPRMLATVPLWPTLGNHDGMSADSATESGAYYDVFTLPRRGEAGGIASGTEAYYSFDHANIHFICLDSHQSDRTATGAMLTWLRADLAHATDADWTIAFWHHPPYTKGSHDSDRPEDSGRRMIDMREFVLPVLEAGGVDLVLGGHSHNYERSRLIDGHYGPSTSLRATMILDGGDGRPGGGGTYEKPTPGRAGREGAVYVVAGSSGKVSPGPINHPVMVHSLNELGSVVLDVDGPRLRLGFIDDAGVERDWFEMTKGASPDGDSDQRP